MSAILFASVWGQEGGSVIPDQRPSSTAKATVMRGAAYYTAPVGVRREVGGPLALALLTTVLLKGGDIIRGRTTEYRMWNIINKLTLLKWGV